MVHIENLVKRYGDLLALDHLNLDIKEGEVFGLLGPNGSGKTTAINCLLALLKYDKGTITLFGQEMHPDSYDLKRQIGVVPQNVAVFDQMTVYENIDYFCGLYIKDRTRRKELTEEAIRFAGLEDHRKMLPRKLSGGLLRRLNIACGIAHKPKLIGTEPAGFHHHIYFTLHGRSGTDLQPHRDHGSRPQHCLRHHGRAQTHDPHR